MPEVIKPVINEIEGFAVRSKLNDGQKKIAARNGQLEEPKQENYGTTPGAKIDRHPLTSNAVQFSGKYKNSTEIPADHPEAQKAFQELPQNQPKATNDEQLVNSTTPRFTV